MCDYDRGYIGIGFSWAHFKKITQQEALAMANKTQEVQAFYAMGPAPWQDCIEYKVTRSCDSPWVACLDDAWVIEYGVKESCQSIFGNQEMKLLLVLNAKTGRFISKFPEFPYIQDERFCLEDKACRCTDVLNNREGPAGKGCINFFQGAFLANNASECGRCQCIAQRCVRQE